MAETKLSIKLDLLGQQAKKSLESLNKSVGSLKSSLGEGKKEFDRLTKSAEKTQEAVGKIAKTAAIAFTGLAASITGAVFAAAKFEDIGVQFEVLTGSVETAQEAMKDLRDFAAGTPFQFADIAKAGKQLLGFGFQVDELKERLREIGDVAAASGQPIQEISLIFGQVAAAGKLTGERLLQFQERAIPIGPAIAKTMGVAESSIKDLVSKGKVSLEIFQKSFASLSEEGGFAFSGLEKLSETLTGRISTLKDNFTDFAGTLGDVFLPIAKNIITALTSLVRTIKESEVLTAFTAAILGAGTVLTAVVATVSVAILVFSKLAIAFSAVKVAAIAMGIGIKGALIASGIGVALVALTLLVTDLALNWDKRTTQMLEIWDDFTGFVSTSVSKMQILWKKFAVSFFELRNKIKSGLSINTDKDIKMIKTLNSEIANLEKQIKPVAKEIEKIGETAVEAQKKIEGSKLGASVDTEEIKKLREKLKEEYGKIEKDLKDAGKSELQILNDKHEERTKLLKSALETNAITQKQFQDSSLRAALKYEEGLTAVTKKEAEKRKKEFQNAVKDPLGELLDLKSLKGVAVGIGTAMANGATGAKNILVNGVGTGIDKMLPGVGNALKPLINAFAKGPKAVRDMVKQFFKAIPQIARNIVLAVPEFIEAIIDGIPDFIGSIVDSVPIIIDSFVQKIPVIISKVVSLVPQIINRLIQSLPQVVVSLANSMPQVAIELAKNMPTVVIAMVKGMPEVAISLVKSLVTLVPKMLGKLFSGLGGNIFESFRDLIAKFNPINIMTKLFKLPGGEPGPVERFIGLNFPVVKFARGGRVPGSAMVPGDSEMNDRVPALLSPGEIVVPRSVVDGGMGNIVRFFQNVGANGVSALQIDKSSQNVLDMFKDMDVPIRTKFGFGSFVVDFIGDALGSVGSAISGGLGFITGAAESLISGDPTGFKNEVSKLKDVVWETVLGYVPIPSWLKEIIASLRLLGAEINVIEFVKNPIEGAKNAVKSVLHVFQPAFKKIVKPAELASGGMIPPGFANDQFPAKLSSGELVVDRSTTLKLQDFLKSNQSSQRSSNSDVLLTKILDALSRPVNTSATIELDNRAFASLLLEMNRSNQRIAV